MNMNGKISNPGALNTQITLQSRVITSDSGGFPASSGSSAATVWANWENVHGSEVWAAQSVQAVQPATVLIRYRTGIDTTWLVLLGTERYEIVSIDDIQNRHEYLELKLRRLEAG